MATCKFYLEDGTWFFKKRPGFEGAQPVNPEVLIEVLGVTGKQDVIVIVPRSAAEEYRVYIKAGTISKVDLYEIAETPCPVTEFVVRHNQGQTI